MLVWINFGLRGKVACPCCFSECWQKVIHSFFVVHQPSKLTFPTWQELRTQNFYFDFLITSRGNFESRADGVSSYSDRYWPTPGVYHKVYKTAHLPSNVRPRRKAEDPKANVKWLLPSELVQSRQWQNEDQLSFHRKEFESTSQRSFAFGLSSVFPQGLKEAMLRTHFEPAPWIDRQLMSPFPLRGDVSQRCGIAFSRSYQKTTCWWCHFPIFLFELRLWLSWWPADCIHSLPLSPQN